MTNQSLLHYAFAFHSPSQALPEAIYECNTCFALVMEKKVTAHLSYAHPRLR